MESNSTIHTINRADGFYKFLALIGLVVAVSSAGLAAWTVQRGQERIFGLQPEIAATSAEAERQQADIRRVQSYLDEMAGKVAAAKDRGTPHYNFLVDEVSKTTRRVEQAQLTVKAKTDVAEIKSLQITLLKERRQQDIRLGGIVAVSGLVLTVIGLICWYWRVQRYLEIETQARMTKHLVEEIVSRSQAEAVRSRDENAAAPEVAVVSQKVSQKAQRA